MVEGKDIPRVLVVDDEPTFTYMLKNRLRKEGYRVTVARNGLECLEKVKEEVPDLVLVDVMMPGMDGFEVCRRLKEGGSTNMKVALLTTKDEYLTQENLGACRADFGIKKPIRFNALFKTLEEYLG
ncbi:MAG: response regulator [Euryarchaeota archaeon]|nr:response regulator [Euryarchaeota archaeon]